MKMPDDETLALIDQLLERVSDLEIALAQMRLKQRVSLLQERGDEAWRSIHERVLAQIQHEKCQQPNEEKSDVNRD